MFNLTARRSIQAALVAGIALVGSSIAAGDELPPRNPATELRRVLDWFPEDMETLVVAQSFSIPKRRSDTPKAAKGAAAFLSSLALGELEDDKHIGPLAGRKVLIAVNGNAPPASDKQVRRVLRPRVLDHRVRPRPGTGCRRLDERSPETGQGDPKDLGPRSLLLSLEENQSLEGARNLLC